MFDRYLRTIQLCMTGMVCVVVAVLLTYDWSPESSSVFVHSVSVSHVHGQFAQPLLWHLLGLYLVIISFSSTARILLKLPHGKPLFTLSIFFRRTRDTKLL